MITTCFVSIMNDHYFGVEPERNDVPLFDLLDLVAFDFTPPSNEGYSEPLNDPSIKSVIIEPVVCMRDRMIVYNNEVYIQHNRLFLTQYWSKTRDFIRDFILIATF